MRLSIPAFVIVSTEALAHDWYTGANDPVTGFRCCAGTDCAPISDSEVKERPDGYIYLPTGEFIPHLRVQYSQDWQFHRCIYQSDFLKWIRAVSEWATPAVSSRRSGMFQ